MPSGDVAPFVVLAAFAAKMVPFQVILYQLATDGMDRKVHVSPSGEVAALAVVPFESAQKTLPFQPTEAHESEAGNVDAVQLMPSGEIAAAVVVP